jgi:hypothetical protein
VVPELRLILLGGVFKLWAQPVNSGVARENLKPKLSEGTGSMAAKPKKDQLQTLSGHHLSRRDAQ